MPSDPAFDEVLKQLDAVPKGSAARGKAQSLREAILRSRQRLAPRPLANLPPTGRDGGADKPPEVLAQQQECAKQAELLGTVKPEARPAAEQRLQQCKRDLAALEEKAHEEAPR